MTIISKNGKMFSNIWPKETKATAWKQKWDALSIFYTVQMYIYIFFNYY